MQCIPKKPTAGFTVVELICIIFILIALTVMALSNMQEIRIESAKSRNVGSVSTLALATSRFALEGHSFTNIVPDAHYNVQIETIVAQLIANRCLMESTSLTSRQILVRFYPDISLGTNGVQVDINSGLLCFYPTKNP